MIITRKHLSRRTFLKGVGVTIGLPLLDAMIPALGWAQGANQAPPTRLGFVYVPNGMIMQNWTPATEGANFAFTPILRPLERFREHTLVVSGMMQHLSNNLEQAGGNHARSGATWLTGARARRTVGDDVYVGISADQIAAQAIGQTTRLPSLELGLDDNRTVGNCDFGYSCAYSNSVSWRTPTTPMPPLVHPRHVFDRLFGNNDLTLDAATRERRSRYRQSILDSTMEATQRLGAELGPDDRRKIEEFLTCIREVERRIQRIEQDNRAALPVGTALERPVGTPVDYVEHAKLMFDMQFLALQADMTRVSTMMLGREASLRTYDHIGVPDPHHPLSHHLNNANSIAKLVRIHIHHMELFAYFINRLATTRDGDASLLDRSLMVYGCGLADSNTHSNSRLPVIILGKGNGTLRSGRHIDTVRHTPQTNLWLALLQRLNVRLERLGDSTGILEL